MKNISGTKVIEANREQMLKWHQEGRSYYWMALKIGLSNRNFSTVSRWFIAQGIRKRVKRTKQKLEKDEKKK